MQFAIRKDIGKYMSDLKKWLAETAETPPEEMSAFFSARLNIYEDHMSAWSEGYRKFARLIPDGARRILDLGCGTGLELDEIFLRLPDAEVTGVDLSADMLQKLKEKHPDKDLRLLCADYLSAEFLAESFDAVISFESLHHFFPEEKRTLYKKLYRCLKRGGVFSLGDYIACCGEEEALLRGAYEEKRRRFPSKDRFVHLDIPLTLAHESELLESAGFCVRPVECVNGATLIRAEKLP